MRCFIYSLPPAVFLHSPSYLKSILLGKLSFSPSAEYTKNFLKSAMPWQAITTVKAKDKGRHASSLLHTCLPGFLIAGDC